MELLGVPAHWLDAAGCLHPMALSAPCTLAVSGLRLELQSNCMMCISYSLMFEVHMMQLLCSSSQPLIAARNCS